MKTYFSFLIPFFIASSVQAASLEDLQRCHTQIAPLTEGPSAALFTGMTALPDESKNGLWIFGASQSYYCSFSRDEKASGLVYHYRIRLPGQEQFYIKYAKANGDQAAQVLSSAPSPIGKKGDAINDLVCSKKALENHGPFSTALEQRVKTVAVQFARKTAKVSPSEKAALREKYQAAVERCRDAFGELVNEQLSKIGAP